jgi:iron complex outermembrane receptor protein
MYDLIVWLPAGSIWQPQNLQEVWTRGFHGDVRVFTTFRRIAFEAHASTEYVISTQEKSTLSNDASLHQQIIYVPRLKHNFYCTARYRKLSFTYQHSYTGVRFIASDNSDWLPPASVGNFFISRSFGAMRSSMRLDLGIYNAWNSDYQMVLNRPMPSRNFQINLNIKI